MAFQFSTNDHSKIKYCTNDHNCINKTSILSFRTTSMITTIMLQLLTQKKFQSKKPKKNPGVLTIIKNVLILIVTQQWQKDLIDNTEQLNYKNQEKRRNKTEEDGEGGWWVGLKEEQTMCIHSMQENSKNPPPPSTFPINFTEAVTKTPVGFLNNTTVQNVWNISETLSHGSECCLFPTTQLALTEVNLLVNLWLVWWFTAEESHPVTTPGAKLSAPPTHPPKNPPENYCFSKLLL